MPRTRMQAALATVAIAVAAILGGGLAARAQQDGVAEKLGETLDRTGRAIKRGVQGAFAKTRTTVHQMAVLDRVYSRLHWEKALATSTLEVEAQPGGIIVVRGVVPDEASRAKALELARNTVGVVQVVDGLSVIPAPATAPAPAAAPAPIVLPAAVPEPTAPAPLVPPATAPARP